MLTAFKAVTSANSAAIIAGILALSPLSAAMAAEDTAAILAEGKKLAFDRGKGNCLACHMIVGGELPGNIGPALVAMQVRFPDKAKLRAQIADPRVANPPSIMPPFIPYGVISESELDKILEYIYTL